MDDQTRSGKVSRLAWRALASILYLFVVVFAAFASIQANSAPTSVLGRVVLWLFHHELFFIVVIAFIILLLAIPFIAWITYSIERKKPLKNYLERVMSKSGGLQPEDIAQSEKRQLEIPEVIVSLPKNFIHLCADTHQPRYEVNSPPAELIEHLRQNSHLSHDEREREIRDFQQSGQVSENKNLEGEKFDIVEALQLLSAGSPPDGRPLAIILGNPGSGKSTTMRWWTYHMAQASLMSPLHKWMCKLVRRLPQNVRELSLIAQLFPFPTVLWPIQIPILISVSEYAKRLHTTLDDKHENLPVVDFLSGDFLSDYAPEKRKQCAALLQNKMEQQRCLFLFDGLDEVANTDLHLKVAENIQTFIDLYHQANFQQKQYNRFIITSRIVGYQGKIFARYSPYKYTLCNFNDEQIKDFLTHWYFAVEMYQMKILPNRHKLTEAQEQEAKRRGEEKRRILLETFQRSPNIKLLAENPLTLTLLALVPQNGDGLPQRRIELYEILTRTLLSTRNQKNERPSFHKNELELVDRILGKLADTLHQSDGYLRKKEVVETIRQVMPKTIRDRDTQEEDIITFFDKLRSSSSLFIEIGLDRFGFILRTFQEYYVALYLLNEEKQNKDKLKQFVQGHYFLPIWREPLLLLIAKKSGDPETNKEANELIQCIRDSASESDTILQRNLLFAARCLVDCTAWSIERERQQGIANDLFEVYGDTGGRGRYRQLQKEIEYIALLWLRSQERTSNPVHLPALLEAWYITMRDNTNVVRQMGAVHLLTSLASELSSCPDFVLHILIPPLLQLANLQYLSGGYPKSLDPPARPASLHVSVYAFIALRLLDIHGPARILYEEWAEENAHQLLLLERLSRHSLELKHLLTPAALPGDSSSMHWKKRIKTEYNWQVEGSANPGDLQLQLLRCSDVATYPLANILKQVLDNELQSSTIPWKESWNSTLKQEMERGNIATYQICLQLRLLLYPDINKDNNQRLMIAKEIEASLAHGNPLQGLALIALANMFWKDARNSRYLHELQEPWPRETHYALGVRDMLDTRKLYLGYLHKLRDRRNIRFLGEQTYLKTMKELLDLRSISQFWNLRNLKDLLHPQDLRDVLDNDTVVSKLCNMLDQDEKNISTILLTLCSMIITNTPVTPLFSHISASVQIFARKYELTAEHRLLVKTLAQLIDTDDTTTAVLISPFGHEIPEALVDDILALRKQNYLSADQVKKLAFACSDTRLLTLEKQEALLYETSLYLNTVQAVAWEALMNSFILGEEAISIIRSYLHTNNAMLCASVAILAQYSQSLSSSACTSIAQEIVKALLRDVSSYRPIQPLDYRKTWKLDDILFEALENLALRGQ